MCGVKLLNNPLTVVDNAFYAPFLCTIIIHTQHHANCTVYMAYRDIIIIMTSLQYNILYKTQNLGLDSKFLCNVPKSLSSHNYFPLILGTIPRGQQRDIYI